MNVAPLDQCHCYALRRASRHVSQLYDQYLASHGLTISQYALVARLSRGGPRSIHDFARELGMDRTTLTRNLKPLERDGLLTLTVDVQDRRSRQVTVTERGRDRIQQATPAWEEAQRHFEQAFGSSQAATLRTLLHTVAATDLALPG